jgi:hypothetical protein
MAIVVVPRKVLMSSGTVTSTTHRASRFTESGNFVNWYQCGRDRS